MTIACTDYVEAVVVLPLVLALRQRAPGVRIAVRRFNPAQTEQQLASGDVDLAVATPDPAHSHLRTRLLFEESYVLIGRRDHPRLRSGLTLEEFVQLEHVVVSPSGGSFTTPIDDALTALGHRRQVVLSAASFLFVPEIVADSDLVALVPRRLLHGQRDRLTSIDLPWLAEHFDVSLIWHERTPGHAGQRWIRELLVELTADATADGKPIAPKHAARRRSASRRVG